MKALVLLLTVVQLAIANPVAIGGVDTRKTRTTAIVSPPGNSISSTSIGKPTITHTQIPNHSSSLRTTSSPDYSQNQIVRGQGSVYGNQGDIANSGNGYIFAINGQGQQSTPVISNAPSPLLMQYFTPQGQPTGQMQYIQLLRPIMVPMPGQSDAQSPSPQPQQSHQTSFQPMQPQSPHISQPQQITQPLPQGQYPQYIPINTGLPPSSSQHPVAQYSNPYGPFSGYSPSPYPSYYNNNQSTRYKYNNPSIDLSLNTNEYMPAASEYAYKTQKYQRA